MILDIILIVLLIGAIVLGNKKGFVKIASGLVTFVIAFVLAYIFANNMANYIRFDTKLGKSLESGINTSVSSFLENENSNDKEDKKQEDQTVIGDSIKDLQNLFGDKINEAVKDGKKTTKEVLTNYVFTGIGFITVFIIVKLILIVATIMLDGVFNLPVLKSFNELFGIIAAVVLLILKIWVALAIVKLIAPMNFMTGIIKYIDSSIITRILYDNNIIISIIAGKIKF